MPQGQIAEDNTKLTIVIPKKLKNEATQIAEADGRTLSSWVRKLIDDSVKEIMKYNK